MSRLGNIRDAMADKLDGHIPSVQVSARALANPTPPAIQIVPGPSRQAAMGTSGFDTFELVVTGFVAFTTDLGSQHELDGMYDRIKIALEADGTLGGTVDDVFVMEASGYRMINRPDNSSLLTSDFTVTVLATP